MVKKQELLIDDLEAFQNLCNLFDVVNVNVNVSRETLKEDN
jgi:hypothetical protein